MKKNVVEMEIKLEKEWLECLDKAYKDQNKKVKIDGFRKGNAPKEIFLKKFGVESLYQTAVNNAISIGYKKVLDKNKDLVPVVEPAVDITEINEKTITLKYKIISKPEVKLGEYKGLGVKKDTVKVSAKEIDEEIKRLQDQLADQIIKEDGVIAEGDTAMIDFKGFVDGKALEGGDGENYPLNIGSHSFIPGFEEALIGHKKDDKFSIDLKFPDNYTKELSGKKVKFDIIVHDIKTRVVPEINEDFFKDLGYSDMKTLDELKKEVKDHLMHEKEHVANDKFIDQCLEAAAKNMSIDINEEIIHEEIHRMMDHYSEQLKRQGMDLETYYKFTKTTAEDLHKQMLPEAEKRIKYRYMLEAIADAEKISFTDKEVDKKAKEMADNYGISVEELIDSYGSKDIIKYDMRMHEALEILRKGNEK